MSVTSRYPGQLKRAVGAKVKAYAGLYDLELIELIVDAGESAKSLERPGLQRALGMLKRGEAEALLIAKLDRLTRSEVDLGSLVERYFAPGKAALLSVSEQIDTPAPAAGDIPWLLLSVKSAEGSGALARAKFVQRVQTKGGVAPAVGCDAAHAGTEARVPPLSSSQTASFSSWR